MKMAFENSHPTPAQSRLVRYALMEMEPAQLMEVHRDCSMALDAVSDLARRCLSLDDDLLEILDDFERIEMAGATR